MGRRLGLLAVALLALSHCAAPASPSPTPTSQKEDAMDDYSGAKAQPTIITVQVSMDTARVLHGQAQPTTQSDELMRLADALGVVLEAIHPGEDDPLLLPHFYVVVQDPARAEMVKQRLLEADAVEGAYLKPPAAAPKW
jgi:hypothetical protein